MPLYLDGNAAGSRFDPAFLVSDGTDQRPVPVNWDSLSVTGGIGWDFRWPSTGPCGQYSI